MSGPRQPINLVIAKGNAHVTKAEVAERQRSEVQPVTDGIAAPSFLSADQKKAFNKIAGQLKTLKIMGETDCDTLARYVVAQDFYTKTLKDIRALAKERKAVEKTKPDLDDYYDRREYYDAMELYTRLMEQMDGRADSLDKRLDRYFKQATTAASKLGLTISDRCKLVVPVKPEVPKTNKFAEFLKVAGDG